MIDSAESSVGEEADSRGPRPGAGLRLAGAFCERRHPSSSTGRVINGGATPSAPRLRQTYLPGTDLHESHRENSPEHATAYLQCVIPLVITLRLQM